MHTLKIIAAGLLLLVVCVMVGRFVGPDPAAGMVRGLKLFVPLWLVGAAANMYIGVTRAGYTVAAEAPIFLVVFAVPALVALTALWWLTRP